MVTAGALMPGFHLGGDYPVGLLLFVGCVLFVGIAALSRQNDRPYAVSAFYLAFGALASVGLGVLGIGRLDLITNHMLFEHVTELALVIAVFGAGLAVEREISRRSKRRIALLLLVVMPLTILAIAGFGVAAMSLPLTAALLLGAILAPTDPVLAGDVGLGPPGGEDQGEPRLSLHTEAGINDGLGSPFVLIGLFVATRGGTGWLGTWALSDVLYAVGAAVLIGVAGGFGVAAAIQRLQAKDILSRELDASSHPRPRWSSMAPRNCSAATDCSPMFAAGIAFRRHEFAHQINARIHHGAETAGRLLELAVLLLLGSTITTTGLAIPGVAGWLLAPLIILIIRPVLVLAVTGRRFLDLRGRLFLGFFGVRGVAALYYATIVAATGDLSHADTTKVVWTTIVCVAISITIHGITATPLTRRLLT